MGGSCLDTPDIDIYFIDVRRVLFIQKRINKIMIDRNIVDEYLELLDFDIIDENNFELVEIKPTDKRKFTKLENEKFKA